MPPLMSRRTLLKCLLDTYAKESVTLRVMFYCIDIYYRTRTNRAWQITKNTFKMVTLFNFKLSHTMTNIYDFI